MRGLSVIARAATASPPPAHFRCLNLDGTHLTYDVNPRNARKPRGKREKGTVWRCFFTAISRQHRVERDRRCETHIYSDGTGLRLAIASDYGHLSCFSRQSLHCSDTDTVHWTPPKATLVGRDSTFECAQV